MNTRHVDCLIIGTGLAGCSAALTAADAGLEVVMITRTKEPTETATAYAQGGIVYASPKEQSPEILVRDILEAGAGICNVSVANLVAQQGPPLVKQILVDRLRVNFDQDDSGSFDLAEEGGHSLPRILHHGDRTGIQIEHAFLNELKKHPNIKILCQQTAVDLLTLSHHSLDAQDIYRPQRCVGAYVFDQVSGEVHAILAKEVVLATGGLGQLYLHTTNPSGARGDGLAMAYRTGARIMNLEYIQFHPTAFHRKSSDRFLITEALRGEGARLINHAGEAFMSRYDSRGDLAPRDIVSRAIHDEMLHEGAQWVLLDISHKPAEWIRNRFPGVYNECLKHGFDLTQGPIPVVPAAHYSCGGVYVNEDGKTSLENLYAVGEVACTGLHGANRLASTSLLEDLVFGVRAAQTLSSAVKSKSYIFPKIRDWQSEREAVDADLLAQDWLTIKHTMWNYVGLIRTPRRLERAHRILRDLSEEVHKFYAKAQLSDNLIGLRNGATAAQLILTAALRNRESIGCHYVRQDDGMN